MSQTALVRSLQQEPLSLCLADEFGAFLGRMNAPRAGAHDLAIKKVLRTAWGSSFKPMPVPAWANDTERPSPIESPALSIYGPSTPAEFYSAVIGGDIANGMMNRFLLLATAKRSAEVEPVASLREIPADLVARLQHVFAARRSGMSDDVTFKVPWGEGAHAIYKSLSLECERRGDENDALVPYLARTAEMAVRLATIRAVGCNVDDPAVTVEDMIWGRDVALWSAERMAEDAGDYVSDTEVGRIRAKIVHKLKAAPSCRMKENDLIRHLSLRSKDLKEHLADLQKMGRVSTEIVEGRGGRSCYVSLVANDNAKPKSRRSS